MAHTMPVIFAMLCHTELDRILQALNFQVDALCAMRTCNSHINSSLSIPGSLIGKFILACRLRTQLMLECPKPDEDWTVEVPRCSSPFCSNMTGLYMPSRADGNIIPRVDKREGSETVQRFMQQHDWYKFVVCSEHCRERVHKLEKMRSNRGNLAIVAVHHYRPCHSEVIEIID